MDYPEIYIAYHNHDQWDMIAFEDKEECKDFCMTQSNFTWTSIPYKQKDEEDDSFLHRYNKPFHKS
ncbi:MAG: hypothetical protein AAFQ94_18745 [Bacteroidota bacterium]